MFKHLSMKTSISCIAILLAIVIVSGFALSTTAKGADIIATAEPTSEPLDNESATTPPIEKNTVEPINESSQKLNTSSQNVDSIQDAGIPANENKVSEKNAQSSQTPAASTKEPSKPSVPNTTTKEPTNSHNHNYISTVVNPTCVNDGYTLYKCACGNSYTDNYQNALGHDYYSETVAPTTLAGGYDLHTCVTCESSYTDNYTDALPVVDEQDPIENNEAESDSVSDPVIEEPENVEDPAPADPTPEATPEIRPEEYYGNCPQCGRMIWTTYYQSGCFTFLEDTVCSCGQLVYAMTCHHH